MRFECNSNDLLKCVSIVEKAISVKTSLPILENLYLELNENVLRLRGNDLEIGIESELSVKQNEAGRILVKSKTLSNVLAKLQNQSISFETIENKKIKIKAGKLFFDLMCLSVDEYPDFPGIEAGLNIEMPIEDFRDLLKHTLFAVSFDDTKQFLNGILFKGEEGYLNAVATDGYRLSLKRKQIGAFEKDFSVIIPNKAVNEINKILQNWDIKQRIKINIAENQVVFIMERFVLVTRIIKGQFPDYKLVIPKQIENVVNIPRRFLLEAGERAAIIAADASNVVRFLFTSHSLVITANAVLGDFREELNIARPTGDQEAMVSFNIQLILDVLRVLDADDISIDFNSGVSPCIIKKVGDEDYRYILMPIRTSDLPVSRPAPEVNIKAVEPKVENEGMAETVINNLP